MIQGVQTSVDNGFKVEVKTTSNRGWTPEELADRALDKLLHVSKDADEQVRAQALVFKEQIRKDQYCVINSANLSSEALLINFMF